MILKNDLLWIPSVNYLLEYEFGNIEEVDKVYDLTV